MCSATAGRRTPGPGAGCAGGGGTARPPPRRPGSPGRPAVSSRAPDGDARAGWGADGWATAGATNRRSNMHVTERETPPGAAPQEGTMRHPASGAARRRARRATGSTPLRRRHLTGTTLILAGLAATLAALVFPVWTYADRSADEAETLSTSTLSTQYGPLSPWTRTSSPRSGWPPLGTPRRPAGGTQGHHPGRPHRGRAPRRGAHPPRRPRPQRRPPPRPRPARGTHRPAAPVARHPRLLAGGGVRPRLRDPAAPGARHGLPAGRPGPREHPQRPGAGARRGRQHHRPGPHQGAGGHGVRRLRRDGP